MKLSIIVSTWNRKDILKRVLNSLANQSFSKEEYEILVCDSHSTDGTDLMIQDFKRIFGDVNLRYLHANANIVASKRNLGIESSKSNFVALLDDDCVPELNFVAKYVAIFKSISPKTVYCGEVRYPQEWINNSNYVKFRDSRHFGSGRRRDLNNVELDAKTIVTMNMAFNKEEILTEIGGMNESFIGYGCEDQEFGWRLNEHGFKIKPCDVKITHYETSGSLDGYMKKIFHTSRDGMRTLLEICPEAAKNSSTYYLFEPIDILQKKYKYKRLCLDFILSSFIPDFVHNFLNRTDKYQLLYAPKLYRLVLAKAYFDGVRARSNTSLTIEGVKAGWYD